VGRHILGNVLCSIIQDAVSSTYTATRLDILNLRAERKRVQCSTVEGQVDNAVAEISEAQAKAVFSEPSKTSGLDNMRALAGALDSRLSFSAPVRPPLVKVMGLGEILNKGQDLGRPVSPPLPGPELVKEGSFIRDPLESPPHPTVEME